jgi:hypothetical protein
MLYIPISMIRKYVITSAPRHGNRFLKNAETCRPRLDLGRHFFADLNFDGFRGLGSAEKIVSVGNRNHRYFFRP